jgi:hypothetical protein
MAFVAADPHRGLGTVIDTGHCMRHVQVVAGVTHSSTLRRGVKVLDAPDDELPRGVVIGTFGPDGRYANAVDGSSHVCILLVRNADRSLLVVDQWQGRPVGERIIVDRQGTGTPVNDASAFYVVEVA